MTAATSTAKKSFFGIHYRNNIIENKKILIINLVLHILGLPLLASLILIIRHFIETGNEDKLTEFNYYSLTIVSFIAILIALASGIIIALFSFRYLYQKSLVDMNYSLPLTTKQRFFADYLSGLTIYMVPAVLGAVLSLIILGIGSAFVELSALWNVFPEIFLAGLIVLVGMLMLYTFTVLTTVFCGSTFEAVFSVFTSNITIPATVCAAFFMIQDASNYVLSEESLISNIFLTATNPAGMITNFFNYVDSIYIGFDFSSKLFIRWLIPTLIFIALYFTTAYFLYKRRKAEQVSKPYVYKIFYYIIMLLAVFCMMSIFIINSEAMAAGIIICAILFFIVEVITKRGFKRFWTSILSFGISIAAVFVFFLVCQNTEGFGRSTYVPSEAAVESVSIYSYCLDVDEDIFWEDEEIIRETIDLHKELIAMQESDGNISRNEYWAYSEDPSLYNASEYDEYIEFTYYMKNGTTVSRSYDVYGDNIGGLLTALNLSDKRADYMSQNMALISFNTASVDSWYATIKEVPKSAIASISICNKLHLNEQTQRLSYNQMIDLMKAYRSDLIAMTEEEYKTSPVYAYIDDSYNYEIRESFVNTIELLNEYGFDDMTVDREYIEEEISESNVRLNIFTNVKALYAHHNYDGSTKYFSSDSFSTKSNYQDYVEYSAQITDKTPDDCLVKIFERGTPTVIDSSVAGAVTIDTNSNSIVLYLPDTDENRVLLKEAKEKYIDGKLVSTDTFYEDDEYYYEGEYYIE